MKDKFGLVMQDLEHGSRRKKKSVLSKLAGSSNQNSPRSLAGSLDSVGNDDDFGLEGSGGSDKPQIDPVTKHHSLLDVAQTGLGELCNDDTDDDDHRPQNFAAAKKNGLGDVDDDDDDSDNDIDFDDNDVAVRQRPGSADGLKKNDLPSSSEYCSARQSLAEHPQLINGDRDVSDDEVSEYEDASAVDTTAEDDQKSPSSTPAAAVLNAQQLSRENSLTKDDAPRAELASSSTIGSSMMKFLGFRTRSPLESSMAASSASSFSGTVTKMSTKDARNRSVFLFILMSLPTPAVANT